MSKRLTAKDWYDVADLCEQFENSCFACYESHTLASRKKAEEWMKKMAMVAHIKARKIEEDRERKI